MKRPEPSDPAIPYLDRLRQGKVKVTPNRRRVLGRFLEGDKPWTLQSLHRSLSDGGDCDLSSVFRALSALRAAGLLEEFRLPGKKETFYSLLKPPDTGRVHGQRAKPHAHHHHIVCRECGIVSHLEVCVPAGLMGKVEEATGFTVTEHHLEFKGV
jgi:Fur family ferric uptake transcriptional regulator